MLDLVRARLCLMTPIVKRRSLCDYALPGRAGFLRFTAAPFCCAGNERDSCRRTDVDSVYHAGKVGCVDRSVDTGPLLRVPLRQASLTVGGGDAGQLM